MPCEPPLDGLEGLKPVRAEIAAPHSRQHDHGHHRDPADPDHDGENMQRPGDNDIIHGWQRPGFVAGGTALSDCETQAVGEPRARSQKIGQGVAVQRL